MHNIWRVLFFIFCVFQLYHTTASFIPCEQDPDSCASRWYCEYNGKECQNRDLSPSDILCLGFRSEDLCHNNSISDTNKCMWVTANNICVSGKRKLVPATTEESFQETTKLRPIHLQAVNRFDSPSTILSSETGITEPDIFGAGTGGGDESSSLSDSGDSSSQSVTYTATGVAVIGTINHTTTESSTSFVMCLSSQNVSSCFYGISDSDSSDRNINLITWTTTIIVLFFLFILFILLLATNTAPLSSAMEVVAGERKELKSI